MFSLAATAFYFWRKRVLVEIEEGAAYEWDVLKKQEPELLDGLDQQKFRAIYERVHMPRFPGYALAIFGTFCASLPISFLILVMGHYAMDALGLIPEAQEVAGQLLVKDGQLRFFKETPSEAGLYYVEDLGGFYYFFGLVAIWLVIVFFFMRRYHMRRPGYLRDEILRARAA